MRTLLHFLLITLTTLCLFACSNSDSSRSHVLADDDEFLADMAALPESYIIPLFYTNLPNSSENVVLDAQTSLENFKTIWGEFKDNYRSSGGVDNWQVFFDDIDDSIAEAELVITDALDTDVFPTSIVDAHEALEAIRFNMAELRDMNGMYSVIDPVLYYHNAMEPIAIAVKTATTPAELTPAMVATINGLLPELLTTSDDLASAVIDPELYGFTATQMAFITQALNGQVATVANLDTALVAKDNPAIFAAAKQIKPLFLKLFFSFADFIKPFEQDMVNTEKSYVLPLFYTNNPAATEAVVNVALTSLTDFESNWGTFKNHYATSPISVSAVLGWTEPFGIIDDEIALARLTLESAVVDDATNVTANITDAHEALEVYRQQMETLRTELNISFVMDVVTAYHAVMEPLVIDTMALASVDAINAELINRATDLQTVLLSMVDAQANMTVELFGYDQDRIDAMQTNLTQQQVSLDAFELALQENPDLAEIKALALQVKMKFVAFFKMFGDFPPVS